MSTNGSDDKKSSSLEENKPCQANYKKIETAIFFGVKEKLDQFKMADSDVEENLSTEFNVDKDVDNFVKS